MATVLRKYYVVASINPKTKIVEFIMTGEWGDSWTEEIRCAKKVDELSKATAEDGMGPKGSLVNGRTLEIWTIQEMLTEVLTVDQSKQKAKEKKLTDLLAQRTKIDEQIRTINEE